MRLLTLGRIDSCARCGPHTDDCARHHPAVHRFLLVRRHLHFDMSGPDEP